MHPSVRIYSHKIQLSLHICSQKASTAKLTKTLPLVCASVNLGSLNTSQISERCLATHRLLFGRPLWAGASPRPRKRKHATDSAVDFSYTEPLPTVDKLLELPLSGTFNITSKTSGMSEHDTSLMDISMNFKTDAQSTATEDSYYGSLMPVMTAEMSLVEAEIKRCIF
ncbi:hypothetical protein Plhal703r1_c13g0068191 [Plasmopara halstedii]